jgi:hypothetical protein
MRLFIVRLIRILKTVFCRKNALSYLLKRHKRGVKRLFRHGNQREAHEQKIGGCV